MNNVKITIKPSSLKSRLDHQTAATHLRTETPTIPDSPSLIDLKLNLNPPNSAHPPPYPQPLLTQRSNPTNEYSHSHSEAIAKKSTNIKSYLRMKPNPNQVDNIQVLNQQTVVCERAIYKFDRVFGGQASQQQIYDVVGRQVAMQFLQGYNGTIFAYGSTGSGKTYTMFGNEDGLVERVVQQVFAGMEEGSNLGCSMVEIYKQNLTDLLSKESGVELRLKEDNVHNLAIHSVSSQEEIMRLIKRGNILKRMRQTHLNESSSRSHVVFTLHLRRQVQRGKQVSCKFNLVDLAGSEKVFKSKVEGEGLEQAKKINLSLSCLGNTISALVKNSDHIPWRQSKLTRILKQSLMGNSITRMIVTCAVTPDAMEETVSSMKFAQRAQKVQTQAEVAYNQGKKTDKREELRLLRQALKNSQTQVSNISSILQKGHRKCSACQQIWQYLERKEREVENIQPSIIPGLFSPKNRMELGRHVSTVPNSRFSSLQKRQSKCVQPEQVESANQKISKLLKQNDRLIADKIALECKIKQLEQPKHSKEKKLIRLSQCKRNPRQLTLNQALHANKSNCDSKLQTNPKHQNHFSYLIQTNSVNTPQQRVSQLQAAHQLIRQTILKLQKASEQYKNTIYPVQMQVLNQQIAYLQGSQPLPFDFSREYKTVLSLKRKICYLVEDLPQHLERLFEHSLAESKEEVSEILREKMREISQISWVTREQSDESCEMTQLQCLLQREKHNTAVGQTTKALITPQIEEQHSQNEFLTDYVSPLPAFSLNIDFNALN